MKKFLLFFALLFFSMSSYALKFEGAGMYCSPESFMSFLKIKGYTFGDKEESEILGETITSWDGKGRVLGKDDVWFIITKDNYYNLIERISVIRRYPNLELSFIDHDHFLSELIKQYGEPKAYYDYRTSPKKDRKKIRSNLYDKHKCYIYYVWKLKDGVIEFYITSDSLSTRMNITFKNK